MFITFLRSAHSSILAQLFCRKKKEVETTLHHYGLRSGRALNAEAYILGYLRYGSSRPPWSVTSFTSVCGRQSGNGSAPCALTAWLALTQALSCWGAPVSPARLQCSDGFSVSSVVCPASDSASENAQAGLHCRLPNQCLGMYRLQN